MDKEDYEVYSELENDIKLNFNKLNRMYTEFYELILLSRGSIVFLLFWIFCLKWVILLLVGLLDLKINLECAWGGIDYVSNGQWKIWKIY